MVLADPAKGAETMRTEEGPRETCSQRPSGGCCWSKQEVLAVEKGRVTQDRK